MKRAIKYIELKSGYSDNGPAWIAEVEFSKSRTTIYFNGMAMGRGNGISGNYFDYETGNEYWVSGVKKEGGDRYSWARNHKIFVDEDIVEEYLKIRGLETLDKSKYEIVKLNKSFDKSKSHEYQNASSEEKQKKFFLIHPEYQRVYEKNKTS